MPFDCIELCLVLKAKAILNEIGFYITENNFTAELLGSNFFATNLFNRWQKGFSVDIFATCYSQFRTLIRAEAFVRIN